MEFRLLGPLSVHDDGGAGLDLGPPKLRMLLAVLLCEGGEGGEGGRVVSADRLADALWGESPPRSAQKNLQLYVHQLRRLLGDHGRIVRQHHGYRICLEPDELD